ncbi:DUF3331 domain-containing protein [Burkholderia sp. SCN-KJ]|uniref:DUF3331 domain-containing protein n=1 Tax=Burkholderia sp. SCN-KJ TaxID=2969248 RepID=UPI0021500D90|nr:DUF3331 domain-containing protein [Burkholderia sp. SCN-KJ]MCR4470483.1 DUF3331 domain-containing protein [Burkholderia sp. SCN-KJ]
MTLKSSEDIIERALLSLLAPQPAPIFLTTSVKNSKFPETKRIRSKSVDETRKKELLPARISIIERPTSDRLSICWSDATSGYFGEQAWKIGLARVQSFCALSGRPIRIGDSVFRPLVSGMRAPPNSHRMILASSVRLSFPGP